MTKKGGDLPTLQSIVPIAKEAVKEGIVPTVKKEAVKYLSTKRKEGLYPPHIRKFLAKRGGDMVKSIKIVRVPVAAALQKAVNWMSLGTFKPALKKLGYDKVMHLGLEINGEVTLDKQAVVTLSQGKALSGKKHAETMDVTVTRPLTFQQLLDNTRLQMGAAKFSNYSATSNNCQDFVIGVLQGNGLLSEAAKKFIKQDAVSIFSQLPVYMTEVTDKITDVAAVADKVVTGQSVQRQTWKSYYAERAKGKTFSGGRIEVNQFMRECAADYKKQKNR